MMGLTDDHANLWPILIDAHKMLRELAELGLFLFSVEDVGIGINAVGSIGICFEDVFEYLDGCGNIYKGKQTRV